MEGGGQGGGERGRGREGVRKREVGKAALRSCGAPFDTHDLSHTTHRRRGDRRDEGRHGTEGEHEHAHGCTSPPPPPTPRPTPNPSLALALAGPAPASAAPRSDSAQATVPPWAGRGRSDNAGAVGPAALVCCSALAPRAPGRNQRPAPRAPRPRAPPVSPGLDDPRVTRLTFFAQG